MKGTVWFVGLLTLLVGGGVGYSRLQQPEEEAAARLVGALGFIEHQIERSSHDILDANPFISPKISSSSSADTFHVAGRVKLLSRDTDSGLERSHVEPYRATVESLCKPYTEKACWRLHALEIEGAAVARHASVSKKVGSSADAEPIETPAVESASNEAPEADDTTAAAVVLSIETPHVKRSATDESNRAPHESAPIAAVPSRALELPFAGVPRAGSSSNGLAADAALPAAPEPPALVQPSRVGEIAEWIAMRAGSGSTEAADETQSRRPSDQVTTLSIGDAEKAAALVQRERPEQEQAAVQESPFATMSAAARQSERRRAMVETPSGHSVAPADAMPDESRSASNLPAEDPSRAARQHAPAQAPRDSAAAEPDTAPVSFPDVTSDRLVARADDVQIPVEKPSPVARVGRARLATASQAPPPGPEPDRADVREPRSAMPAVAATAESPKPEQPAEPPLTESELRELEQALAALGFYPGPVDGTIDGESEQAIRSYQHFAALPSDGVPGRRLLDEMRQIAQLAGLRDRAQVRAGGDGRPGQIDQGAPSIAADRQELALASPGEAAPSGQQSAVIPPRKPEQPKLPAGAETKLAASTNESEQPLSDIPKLKPVKELGEIRQSVATPVTITMESLPREIGRAIQTGALDVRLASGHTPLTAAVTTGRRDAVAALLAYGADPDIPAEDQATALMYAAWGGDVDSVRLLLEAGADPNQRNRDDKTALMAAAANGHAEIVRLLLEAGGEPDLQALKGWTALMYAVWRDEQEVVQLLLKHRANVLIANNRGDTAVDLAAERQNGGIYSLLLIASGSS
ncbi:MAG: ankyrin repeat domain-containing protein [Kiloniellales bacterium]